MSLKLNYTREDRDGEWGIQYLNAMGEWGYVMRWATKARAEQFALTIRSSAVRGVHIANGQLTPTGFEVYKGDAVVKELGTRIRTRRGRQREKV